MKSRTRLLIALIISLTMLPLIPVGAKDIDGQFATFSKGSSTCSDYNTARADGGRRALQYMNWVAGYLTAFNIVVSNTYNILGQHAFADAAEWLDGYCRANPKVNFANATADLTVNLYENRSNMGPNGSNAEKWSKIVDGTR